MLLKNKLEIEEWLNKYEIKNYELISDEEYSYVVNVNGFVDLSYKKLKSIEVKFNIIEGNFYCNNNYLKTLKGCPEVVNSHFDCANNKLENLEGSPKVVEGNFICRNNKLSTLKGCPEIIKGGFTCEKNQLETLENGPKIVKNIFICSDNQLKTLKGCPKVIKGELNFIDNKLNIDGLKYMPKKGNNKMYIYNNPELGELQYINEFKELKKIIDIIKQKEKLNNLLNMDKSKIRVINKI